MLHHISLAVSDLERSAAFYDATLGALGYRRVWSFPDAIGHGSEDGNDRFAIKKRGDTVLAPSPGFHLAFEANDESSVQAFHAAALRSGGTDNGAPGLRTRYAPRYYAAFVLDPDGYALEAVINQS